VDFDIRPGEVHVLLGENGAGKSTLVKIMSGAYRPDEGEVYVKGEKVEIHSPQVAQDLGISTVYQELSLVPDLPVAKNIFLGHEPVQGLPRLLDDHAMVQEARRLLRAMDVDLDPRTPVRRLSLAMRQVVEIVKALARNSRIIILDEPTSSLSEHETEELFARIQRLKADGVGICYISHRLEELARVGDRVTVMRDGRVIAAGQPAGTPISQLVRLMAGRDLSQEFPQRATSLGPELLRVENLSVPGRVFDVSFSLHAGEVLGLFGLVGAGRTELLRAIFGAEHGRSGRIFVKGRQVDIARPQDAIASGLGLVPEDRHHQGLVLGMSVQQNIAMASLRNCTRRGFIVFECVRRLAQYFIERLRIKVRSPGVRVATLSGGNQQKVVIARALATGADVVLLDEPTRGIDVGAKVEMYHLVNDLVSEGKAVLLVSSEMVEILGLSDRILVMRQGRISLECSRREATQENLLTAAFPTDAEAAA
jgi:ribose transport system ATP-binding protein